ncbi:MFS transporter [Tuanshanicoccus lijuaniae]|uniref:MFS transporter n=1 Tax=Aerococcaceae bacterium zg-1292 TaxID=2774330 RepID=UPI0019352AEA|nr:MFS transporter [Aerococcaceae bacterium zg-1292]QQA37021.1 MFS transporter [Aerococcaceae bacterium zg-1292]
MFKKNITSTQKNQVEKIGFIKTLGWASRAISVAANTIIIGYLMIFCTDTLNMPATLVGTLIMISKLFDGVTDFVASYIVDNTKTKWGKGRPYEWCIVGVWLCTLALFYTPVSWSMTVKAIWVFLMYTMVFSMFTTLLLASQTPYMIRAFDNDNEKIAKVGIYGGLLTMIGGIIVSVSFPIMMAKLATGPEGWRTLILIYALPLLVIGLGRFFIIKEDPFLDETSGQEKVTFKDVLDMLKENKYTWATAGMAGFYNVVIGMNAATYYFTYIVGDIALYSTIQFIGILALPVTLFFPFLMKRYSVSQMIAGGAIISAVGYLLYFFAGKNIPLLLLGAFISGVGQFPFVSLQANLSVQMADYNEYIGLARLDSSVGLLGGAFAKIGGGIGSALLGILLGLAGYTGATAVQSETSLLMIRLLFSIIPMCGMILMAYCVTKFFSLDKQQDDIIEALKLKRTAHPTNE